MKFNMGCGRRPLEGFVNVDSEVGAGADQVWDLEQTPWPWPDDCAEEVRFIHSLEHMGGDPRVFLAIMRELYRICAPGAVVTIHVPHYRHDNFLLDPTHVRAIGPSTLHLFDRALNDEWQRDGRANSPLAHYNGVDFKLEAQTLVIDEPFGSQRDSGELGDEELQRMLALYNNVASEYRFTLRVRKP